MKIRKHNIPIFTFYELSICFTLFVLLILARIIDLTPLTVEDGIIEYISAFFWFCGFVVSIVYLIQRRKSIIISILCIVCFVSLGEEISWGQRILSIETPKNIAAMNRQSEFNLHNMYMLSPDGSPWRNFFKTGNFHYKQLLDAQNLFRMGFLIHFLVFPLFMKFGICSKILSKIGYQVPPSYFLILLWIFIIFSFVITIDLNTVIDKERFLAHCVQEIREMSYSIFITVDIFRMFVTRMYYSNME